MESRKLTFITKAVLIVALAMPFQLTAQHTVYTVTDLGTLGGTFSLAGGISNSGAVEGWSTLPGDTALHAFLWRNGVMTDLGTLGGPNSIAAWRPNESDNAGGGAETATPDPLGEDFCGFGTNLICLPFLWEKGVITPLPTLGGNNGFAAGVNSRGQVVGQAENSTPDPTCEAPQVLQFKPVVWEKGQVQELPTFQGDPDGQANAINDNGQVVGFSGHCIIPVQHHALLWQSGVMTDLGNFGGTRHNNAVDINNQGQVVGTAGLPADTALSFHAFLWQNDVLTDLGTLPEDVASSGDGINSKTQVVGASLDVDGNEPAFLWQNGVMTDLNTLIPADSPLFLIEATGTINSRGQIAGIALQISTGEVHAFLATPSTGEFASESATLTARGETSRAKVVLPENVRKMLREGRAKPYLRSGLGGGSLK
jgi:probable HAF family extracellular repeat protein